MEVSGRKTEEACMETEWKSSAEDGEVVCQPCRNDGDWMVAIGYCENCNEYMCSTCLKVHRKQAMSRNHKVMEGENMPRAHMTSVAINACSKLYAKHTNEIVKFHCSKHDIVGCCDCMVLDHKACKVDRIQDISVKYFNGTEHQELQQKVDQYLQNIEMIRREVKKNGKTMQQTYMKAENDIKAFKKEITNYLDKAEADMLAEMNKRKLGGEKLMSDLQEHEKNMKDDIQELHEKLQLQFNQANELFIAAKEMKEKIKHIGDSIKQLQQNCKFKVFEFVCSENVKEMFASSLKLGELEKRTVTEKTIVDKSSAEKKNIAEMEPHFKSEIAIKTPNDTANCSIAACALISPRWLILADEKNKCLKIVDIEYKKISKKYKLKSGPTGVAVVTHGRIAVALPDEKKIQFLTILQDDEITESYAIKVKDKCRIIACHEDKIIVAYSCHFDIMKIDGQEIKTIRNSNLGWIHDIATDSNTVFVSHGLGNCNVFKHDFSGKLIETYQDPEPARGLTVTSDGSVLLCKCQNAESITVLSPQCKKIKGILKLNQHVRCPWCVSFCDESNTLFLCNLEVRLDPKLGNNLKIFQLQ